MSCPPRTLSTPHGMIPPVQIVFLEALKAEQEDSDKQNREPWPCPICGDDRVELIGSGVARDGNIWLFAADRHHRIRGANLTGIVSATATLFRCGCGHTFATTLQARDGRVVRGLHQLHDDASISAI